MQALSILVLFLAIGTACKKPPAKPTFGDGDAVADDGGSTDDSGDDTADDADSTDDTSTASTDGTDGSTDGTTSADGATTTSLLGGVTSKAATFNLSNAATHAVANNCSQALWIQSSALSTANSVANGVKVEPGKKVKLVTHGAWTGKLWGQSSGGDAVALNLTKGKHRHLVFCAKN